ncbi:hypothetical protein [Phenylobacterium sp.]|jgi:hypothetical protein|uniref:hypothetical protein n=1 Tax=Phenylobacterium sp. TaxID=1871053 RepID=UPI002F930EDF
MTQERTVITVVRHDGAWAVQLDGELFGHSTDKEVCKAAANRRARDMQDGGRACQVKVMGELGYFSS